jgi:hypothetical protein
MSTTTPGLVCAHYHLYSVLARDMPALPFPRLGHLATSVELLERSR